MGRESAVGTVSLARMGVEGMLSTVVVRAVIVGESALPGFGTDTCKSVAWRPQAVWLRIGYVDTGGKTGKVGEKVLLAVGKPNRLHLWRRCWCQGG